MSVESRDPKHLGELVRRARQNAGMSMEQLARRSGHSLSTIKNIEHGKPGVKRDTLEAIFIALGIDSVMDDEFDRNSEWVLWVMQDQQLFVRPQEIAAILSQKCGIISYSDYNLSLQSTQMRQSHFSGLEYSKSLNRIRTAIVNMGKIIAQRVRLRQLDVISLTCGHGWHEFDLVASIVDNGDFSIRLFLVHPSYHLMLEGLRVGSSRMSDTLELTTRPIVGGYQSINSMRLFSPALMNGRVRLLCLFAVFANEDNDDLLVKSLSQLFQPGDLLLIDVYIPQWDYLNERQILRHDPRINGQLSRYIINGSESYMEQTLKEHISVPFEIKWRYELRANHESIHDRVGIVRNSMCEYYIEAVALLNDGKSAPREVSALRFNRHQPERVIERFRQYGWVFVSKTVTEREANHPAAAACMLFQKL